MTRAADVPREAYAACEAITRREARNFSYGIRLLPPDKRAALSAVYALARRIDDIGDDGTLTHPQKTAALGRVRVALREPADHTDPVLTAVTDACARYPIPLSAFDELVDGVEADVAMDLASGGPSAPARPYRTFDDMVGYCRQVAGSVGRLCLGVFGSRPHPDAARYADQLGIALQQTNILRDIREDLRGGRVYLPTEELAAFGVGLELDADGRLADPTGGLDALIRHCAARARGWYDDGLRLVPLLDRRSAACAIAMSGIYRQLLDDIAADPSSVYGRRVSLSGRRKVGVAVRALAGRGAHP